MESRPTERRKGSWSQCAPILVSGLSGKSSAAAPAFSNGTSQAARSWLIKCNRVLRILQVFSKAAWLCPAPSDSEGGRPSKPVQEPPTLRCAWSRSHPWIHFVFSSSVMPSVLTPTRSLSAFCIRNNSRNWSIDSTNRLFRAQPPDASRKQSRAAQAASPQGSKNRPP